MNGRQHPFGLTHGTLSLCVGLALLFAGCQKYQGPQGRATKPKTEPTAATADAAPPAEPKAEKREPTFAETAQELTERLNNQIGGCIADFVAVMDMKKIDQGFLPVDLNRMDKTCREAISTYKKAAALLAKHPVLDALLEHGATFSDAYLRMSARLKQLGARDRWRVVRDINESREKVLTSAASIASGVSAIQALPPATGPATDVHEERVPVAGYRQKAAAVADWMGERLPAAVESYRVHAYRPADLNEMISVFAFRHAYLTTSGWFAVAKNRFDALSCDGPERECGAIRTEMATLFAAGQAIIDGYKAGLEFYRGDFFRRLDRADVIWKDLEKAAKEFDRALKKARRAIQG